MFRFRPNSTDENCYRQIICDNEYKIKNGALKDKIVIDAGANIGCFIKLAMLHGAKFVDAYEIEDENYQACLGNCGSYKEKVRVNLLGIWRSDEEPKEMSFSFIPGLSNDKSVGVLHRLSFSHPRFTQKSVMTIGLDAIIDDILKTYGENIYLLKMDVEGSEHDILHSSKKLEFVDNLVCEWHNPEISINDLDVYNLYDNSKEIPLELVALLKSQGFHVYRRDYARILFAMKDPQKSPFFDSVLQISI